MFWKAIYYKEPIVLVGIEGNLDSMYYCTDLENASLKKEEELYGARWTF